MRTLEPSRPKESISNTYGSDQCIVSLFEEEYCIVLWALPDGIKLFKHRLSHSDPMCKFLNHKPVSLDAVNKILNDKTKTVEPCEAVEKIQRFCSMNDYESEELLSDVIWKIVSKGLWRFTSQDTCDSPCSFGNPIHKNVIISVANTLVQKSFRCHVVLTTFDSTLFTGVWYLPESDEFITLHKDIDSLQRAIKDGLNEFRTLFNLHHTRRKSEEALIQLVKLLGTFKMIQIFTRWDVSEGL